MLRCLEKLSPASVRLDIARGSSELLGEADCDEHLVDVLSPPKLELEKDRRNVLLGVDSIPYCVGSFEGLRDDLGVDVLELAAETLLLLDNSCCLSKNACLIADIGLPSDPSLKEGQLSLRTAPERGFTRFDGGRTPLPGLD